MKYIDSFLKRNYHFYSEIALTTGLFFCIQEFGTLYILKDTTGKAGFYLFTDIAELTFILILLMAILYNAIKSRITLQGAPFMQCNGIQRRIRFIACSTISYIVVGITVSITFIFTDSLRYIVCHFYETADNFTRFSYPHVFLLKNLNNYFLSGPLYIKMNSLASLLMTVSLLTLSSFIFRKNVLFKTLLLGFILGSVAVFLFISGTVKHYFSEWYSNNIITVPYICLFVELTITCLSIAGSMFLHGKRLPCKNGK